MAAISLFRMTEEASGLNCGAGGWARLMRGAPYGQDLSASHCRSGAPYDIRAFVEGTWGLAAGRANR